MIFATIGLLAASLPVLAQTGQITGEATDQHGKAIVGATVQITNQETAQKTVVKTDAAAGSYTAPNLSAGRYVIVISAPGFATSTSAILTLVGGQALTYDALLEIGSVNSSVTVMAGSIPMTSPCIS